MDKISAILAWAEDKPWFDTSFVEDVENFYYENNKITPSQEQALDNIIFKFKIRYDQVL
jgi:hypothetical protein